jgi:hypothetical protein
LREDTNLILFTTKKEKEKEKNETCRSKRSNRFFVTKAEARCD